MKKKDTVYGTQEWATGTVNIQNGCANDCRYCYAKEMAIRFKRKTQDNWKEEELRPDDINKNYKKQKGTCMFPSSHDITAGNIDACITVLRKLLKAGNQVLIVSKPDPACIRQLCDELGGRKEQMLFRFTIGSADDDVLRFWEPHAAAFDERLDALNEAYWRGFKTSVSCEPMLDNNIELVVDAVLPMVTDAVWIGLPNKLKQRVSVNCGDDESMRRAEELLDLFTEERIAEIYAKYADNPQVKWKESMKQALGLEIPEEAGLDI